MLLTKQAENAEMARLENYRFSKILPAAPVSCSSYIVINFCLEKLRKEPHFEKNSAGMEDGEGRLPPSPQNMSQ